MMGIITMFLFWVRRQLKHQAGIFNKVSHNQTTALHASYAVALAIAKARNFDKGIFKKTEQSKWQRR